MSRCFTLRRTGFDGPIELSNGIVVDRSSTPHWPDSVDVGRDYEYDYGPEGDYDLDYRELVTHWITLPLDRKRPPVLVECRDGTWRMVRASIIDVGGRKFAHAEYPGQDKVLVHINTGHTEPCETGGYWVAKSGHPEAVMHGKQGQRTCKVYHRGGSYGYIGMFDEPDEEVDNRTAWDIGILLLSPGDSLEVTFKAPGKVVGLLTCVSATDVRFELVTNEIDLDYQWEPPDYQEVQDMRDDSYAWDRRHGDPFDEMY